LTRVLAVLILPAQSKTRSHHGKTHSSSRAIAQLPVARNSAITPDAIDMSAISLGPRLARRRLVQRRQNRRTRPQTSLFSYNAPLRNRSPPFSNNERPSHLSEDSTPPNENHRRRGEWRPDSMGTGVRAVPVSVYQTTATTIRSRMHHVAARDLRVGALDVRMPGCDICAAE